MLIQEDGIITGNVYDKYGTKNPIARFLMKGFFDSIDYLLSTVRFENIHEVGCGEGCLSMHLAKRGFTIRASDFSVQIVGKATSRSIEEGIPILFKVASIYDLDVDSDSAELILCCEVLEHLDDPDRALDTLSKLARPYLLVSIPREPIWRILNLCRGKYIKDFGNTPGHIQHWSRTGFLQLLERYFEVVDIRCPFPWTVALCKVKLHG